MRIKEFKGKYAFLDNFRFCKITIDGITYDSTESAFQAQKCITTDDRKRFIGLNPREAKNLGRHIKLRPDWEDIKFYIMYDVVKQKFTNNENYKQKLLATGDAYLEEGNHHNDRIWGKVDGRGTNWLGKILMKVRDELRE